MIKTVRKFLLATSILIISVFFTVAAEAAGTSGISVSESELSPGDRFTVTVTVPPSENADTASVRVEFDADAFTVKKWEPALPGCIHNAGKGFFALNCASASRTIGLDSGLTFTAEISVNKKAESGRYTFELKNHSFSYVKENGYEFTELWSPDTTRVSVNVSGTDSSSAAEDNDAVRDAASGMQADEPKDTDSPESSGNSVPDEPEDEEAADEPEDGEKPDNPEDAADGSSDAKEDKKDTKVSLVLALSGLPKSMVRVTTRPEFFSGNTEIKLASSPLSKEVGDYAADKLGYTGHDRYCFDISLLDKDSGEKIVYISKGSIELSIPLPENFAKHADSLKLFHIDGDSTVLIDSTVTEEDGIKRIEFSTNSFSPYVIVDTAEQPDAVLDEMVTPRGSTASSGPVNPSTGAAAAILIPAALAGCIILARKSRR